LARKLYEQLRREAAALKIEKNFKGYIDRKSYSKARSSAIILQTGLRSMKARDEFRFRKQTKAAIKIQVLLLIFIIRLLSYEEEIMQSFFYLR
jgi:myosin-5